MYSVFKDAELIAATVPISFLCSTEDSDDSLYMDIRGISFRTSLTEPQVSLDEIRSHNRQLADGYDAYAE